MRGRNQLHETKEKNIQEITRIKQTYQKRYESDMARYSLFHPGEFFMDVTFERELIKSLKKAGVKGLAEMKILEVGCGNGRRLRNFQRLGAVPSNEYGIELLDIFVEDAQILSSNCHIRQGDASALPYTSEFFDIVYQRTVFTSIFDVQIKMNIALEMLRVLKSDGCIIWYDFRLNNPKNPDVKGVSKKEIVSLFPNCRFDFTLVTLAPPLTRAIAPYSYLLCYLLDKLPFLRTHYLGIIRKTRTSENQK
ncbi:class I SAM-dependent methyltransferase [Desulfococcaceae bacterium HSG7]|nr:class I SAM-dependent methyltransferase [Desulfococcaceae bacterium HSG7]